MNRRHFFRQGLAAGAAAACAAVLGKLTPANGAVPVVPLSAGHIVNLNNYFDMLRQWQLTIIDSLGVHRRDLVGLKNVTKILRRNGFLDHCALEYDTQMRLQRVYYHVASFDGIPAYASMFPPIATDYPPNWDGVDPSIGISHDFFGPEYDGKEVFAIERDA